MCGGILIQVPLKHGLYRFSYHQLGMCIQMLVELLFHMPVVFYADYANSIYLRASRPRPSPMPMWHAPNTRRVPIRHLHGVTLACKHLHIPAHYNAGQVGAQGVILL